MHGNNTAFFVVLFCLYKQCQRTARQFSLVSTHNIIEGDSRLVNIRAGNGFLGLHDKKVTIRMGSILSGYGDVGVF